MTLIDWTQNKTILFSEKDENVCLKLWMGWETFYVLEFNIVVILLACGELVLYSKTGKQSIAQQVNSFQKQKMGVCKFNF